MDRPRLHSRRPRLVQRAAAVARQPVPFLSSLELPGRRRSKRDSPLGLQITAFRGVPAPLLSLRFASGKFDSHASELGRASSAASRLRSRRGRRTDARRGAFSSSCRTQARSRRPSVSSLAAAAAASRERGRCWSRCPFPSLAATPRPTTRSASRSAPSCPGSRSSSSRIRGVGGAEETGTIAEDRLDGGRVAAAGGRRTLRSGRKNLSSRNCGHGTRRRSSLRRATLSRRRLRPGERYSPAGLPV